MLCTPNVRLQPANCLSVHRLRSEWRVMWEDERGVEARRRGGGGAGAKCCLGNQRTSSGLAGSGRHREELLLLRLFLSVKYAVNTVRVEHDRPLYRNVKRSSILAKRSERRQAHANHLKLTPSPIKMKGAIFSFAVSFGEEYVVLPRSLPPVHPPTHHPFGCLTLKR